MSSENSVSIYKIQIGVIFELYKQNLIKESEKDESLNILRKKYLLKGEKNE